MRTGRQQRIHGGWRTFHQYINGTGGTPGRPGGIPHSVGESTLGGILFRALFAQRKVSAAPTFKQRSGVIVFLTGSPARA
jgi:hypothetical protein